jgi:hypothetical protein
MRLKKVLVLGAVLVCLLAASKENLRADSIKNSGDSQRTKMHVLTLPLDSMDGLEVRSIKVKERIAAGRCGCHHLELLFLAGR